MRPRVALFGGSFDPFHLGHFLVARAAWERLGLHRVVFIPCARSPLKKFCPVASDSARCAMLRVGLRGHSWARVWSWEVRKGGVSYTVDTVRAWAEGHPKDQLYWLMGSDQWASLPDWKQPEELRRRVHFLVFPRPNRPRSRRAFRMTEISLRFDVSATEVRRRLRKRLAVDGLLLPGVEKMIRQRRWYR